jgi:hypothetical protein
MFRTCLTWKLSCSLLTVAGTVCLAVAPPAAAPTDTVAPASAASDDTAAKKQILDSTAWRQAMLGFNEWLSVQVVYDKNEVPQVKAQLSDKINKMSAAQLGPKQANTLSLFRADAPDPGGRNPSGTVAGRS